MQSTTFEIYTIFQEISKLTEHVDPRWARYCNPYLNPRLAGSLGVGLTSSKSEPHSQTLLEVWEWNLSLWGGRVVPCVTYFQHCSDSCPFPPSLPPLPPSSLPPPSCPPPPQCKRWAADQQIPPVVQRNGQRVGPDGNQSLQVQDPAGHTARSGQRHLV